MDPISRDDAEEILRGMPLRMPEEEAYEKLAIWLSWADRLCRLPEDPCPSLPARRERLRALKKHAGELARLLADDPFLALCIPRSKGWSIGELKEIIDVLQRCSGELADLLEPDWERLSSTSVDIHYKGRARPLDLGRRNALWCLLDCFEDLTGQEATVTLGGSPCLDFVEGVSSYIGVDMMTEAGLSRERTLYKQRDRWSPPTTKMKGDGLYRALARAKKDRSGSEEHPVDWARIIAIYDSLLP